MTPRRAVLVGLLLVLACLPARAGPDPHATARKGLERQALALAKAGRADATRELLAILQELGVPERAFERLSGACTAALADVEPTTAPQPAIAAALRKGARAVGSKLGAFDEEERRRIAGVLLRLDAGLDAAHEALGHVRTAGRWLAPEQARFAERAAQIDSDVAAARSLAVEITELDSPLPFANERADGRARAIRAHGITLHGAGVPVVTLREVLTGLVRGMALARRLESAQPAGELAAVDVAGGFQAVLCSSHDGYRAAIRSSVESGDLGKGDAGIARQTTRYADGRGFHVVDAAPSDFQCASLLVEVWHQDAFRRHGAFPQPALAAGHLNRIALDLYARPIPGFVFRATADGATSAADAARTKDLLEKAGRSLPGARDYLAHLAAQDADPPFARSITQRLGKIDGAGLLKCTVVAAFLHERGDFGALLTSTVKADRRPAAFEEPLGGPLAAFETAWKAWLLARPSDLASRLER